MTSVVNKKAGPVEKPNVGTKNETEQQRFTAALDALGIPWTRSTKYIVSIYRKAATARLDEFVGPKDRAVPLNGVHYAA